MTVHPETPVLPWREQAPPVEAGAPYVVLNFGSNEPGRRWPFESYLQLAERLLDKGFRVVFTGGKGEVAEEGRLMARLDRPEVVNLIARTSLPELLDLLKHAHAVVTADTGPMHLAIALGAPTVATVGGGHFGSFIPYPPEATPPQIRFAYEIMPCYHCFWNCTRRSEVHPDGSFPCVAAIGLETVWSLLGEVCDLSAGRSAP